MKYNGQTFTDETVVLDDNTFKDCTFKGCTFVYSGGTFGFLDGLTFEAPLSFRLRGPAEGTMHLLRYLYRLDADFVVRMLSTPPDKGGPIAEA